MSLMAIILWALYPLSPWKRIHESARHLLTVILRNLTDPRTVDWLCANPDDPSGIARIEHCIDDLNASIDFIVYLRARAILGLPQTGKRPSLGAPQPRRTRTFRELQARLDACALRFAGIERLAQRRAEKLGRLLAKRPNAVLPRAEESPRPLAEQQAHSGGGSAYLFAPPLKATPVPLQTALASTEAPASLPRSVTEAGARRAHNILIFYLPPTRAGLRVRAPP